MIDLSQVSMAIRNSTAKSMIILDEFGKGTLSADGAGLLCGVLNHLLSRGPECPKVLVATHFHEIFRNDLLRPSLPIFFAHMEVIATPLDSERMEQGTEGDEIEMKRRLLEQFTFLYRVAPGLSLDSYATHCALINGVPRRVVERARYVSSLLLDHNITTLLDEQMSEKEEEEMLDAESVIKRFCEMELSGEEGERDVRRRLRAVLGTSDQSIEQ
ncbi:MutS protein msh5 [Tulasnella sp. 418]|nr:MutS protein msh5 [Tulasnella sp. 418]